MTTLFRRAAMLTVQQAAFIDPSSEADTKLDASVFEKLRITFRIEKTAFGHPNQCEISLYNASSSSRAKISRLITVQRGNLVIIEAGYEGRTAVLFKGWAQSIDHVRSGPDWITRIRSAEGVVGYADAPAKQTFKAGTAVKEILAYLANQVRGADGSIDVSGFLARLTSGAIKLVKGEAVTGDLVDGNAFRELEKRLAGEGYQVTVQNGELLALKSTPDEVEGTRTTVLLSAGSGLLGSPEHAQPVAPGVPTVLRAKALLQPRISPGDFVTIDSLELKGVYRAEKVTHTGDTHGQEWTTELELRPAPTAVRA